MENSQIILATDELSFSQCLALGPVIGDRVWGVKLHNHYDELGPDAVKRLRGAGFKRFFVDDKIHDIPNTAERRAEALVKAGADIITVHASGAIPMMKAAVKAAPQHIYAVTVLTSLDNEQVKTVYGGEVEASDANTDLVVSKFAFLANEAGVKGLVCPPTVVDFLHAKYPELELIVPGTRSAGKEAGDQKRVKTPAHAIKNGASYLVIGRQITEASDPVAALDEVEGEIQAAQTEMRGEGVL